MVKGDTMFKTVIMFLVLNYLGDTIAKFEDRQDAMEYLSDTEAASRIKVMELMVRI